MRIESFSSRPDFRDIFIQDRIKTMQKNRVDYNSNRRQGKKLSEWKIAKFRQTIEKIFMF